MQRQSFQFALVRAPLLLVGLVFCLALALVLGVLYWHDWMENQVFKLQREIADIGTQSRALQTEYHTARSLTPDYQRVVDSGFIGAEKRLVWIERLEADARALGLNGLHYKIGPQTVAPRLHYVSTPDVELFTTQLEIDTALLHEGDLSFLIHNLFALPAGFARVERCEIKRRESRNLNSADHSFRSNCTLTWFTARYDVEIANSSEDMM